ncbi:cyclophilin-like fold protein [Tuanshanicoccus lijuaniae]|uniref:cyclophilin-like fold protein n=1 Tax=Aerococcaceae bacterium zg-1292 TaxID=2774330 RepID=UPI0040629F14
MKKPIAISIVLIMIITLSNLFPVNVAATSVNTAEKQMNHTRNIMKNKKEDKRIILKVNDEVIEVEWVDNKTVSELKEALRHGDVTVESSRYGGVEQVGALGRRFSTNDKRTTTEAGDIMLYTGNHIVLFYGKHTWSYTRLGKIKNLGEKDIAALLNHKDVRITLQLK